MEHMDGRSTASPLRSSYSSPLDSPDCGWGLQDFSDFNAVDVMSPASFRGPTFSYGGWLLIRGMESLTSLDEQLNHY